MAAGRRRQINPGNLGAGMGRERRHPNVIVGHGHLPSYLRLKPVASIPADLTRALRRNRVSLIATASPFAFDGYAF
jgi:hypothetical protein